MDSFLHVWSAPKLEGVEELLCQNLINIGATSPCINHIYKPGSSLRHSPILLTKLSTRKISACSQEIHRFYTLYMRLQVDTTNRLIGFFFFMIQGTHTRPALRPYHDSIKLRSFYYIFIVNTSHEPFLIVLCYTLWGEIFAYSIRVDGHIEFSYGVEILPSMSLRLRYTKDTQRSREAKVGHSNS